MERYRFADIRSERIPKPVIGYDIQPQWLSPEGAFYAANLLGPPRKNRAQPQKPPYSEKTATLIEYLEGQWERHDARKARRAKKKGF